MQRLHKIIREHKLIHLSTNARKALFPKIVSLNAYEFTGKIDPFKGLHKLFGQQKPAVLLASIACEVETVGVSVQYRCTLASRWHIVRMCYQLGCFRVAVRLFQPSLLPCGLISRVEQLQVSPSHFSIVLGRCRGAKCLTVVDRSTLNLFYIHIPVGSFMWWKKIHPYVNSPAQLFSFPFVNSFLGGQACSWLLVVLTHQVFIQPMPDAAVRQTIQVFPDA